MITSVQQLNKTQARIAELQSILQRPPLDDIPPPLLETYNAQLQAEITVLYDEIKEYEAAQNADLHNLVFESFYDFWKAPIIVRLALQMTVSDFAQQVSISERQLIRYEANEYRNAKAEVIEMILEHFRIQGRFELKIAG